MQHAWSGRFRESPSASLDAINRSIGFDIRLWREDIEGSRAHARMLARIGLLSEAELAAIDAGLAEIAGEFAAGTFAVHPTDEDIHMAVERRLTEVAGDAGRKLHAGRSRNDQVATDVRLFVRRACDDARARISALLARFAALAAHHAGDAMPAYTHLQRAIPTTLGHHLLAHGEALLRDADRFADCRRRANVSPLGAGSCVGSTLPLDRVHVAAELHFDGLTANSIDAVADRDFVVEFLFAASLTMLHLSRLGEELVLWTTHEFGFAQLGDAVTTGSSMMPNKKNPDGAELLRGKAGRVIGDLVGLLTTLKGLPLAYNKDLQEDKEPLFDAVDTLRLSLDMALAALSDIRFDTARMRAACSQWMNATDLMEALVRAGEPLRAAHHQTGRVVAAAVSRGVEIEQLPLADVRALAPRATAEMLSSLTVERALSGRDMPGGTAPARVTAAAAAMRDRATELLACPPET